MRWEYNEKVFPVHTPSIVHEALSVGALHSGPELVPK
jgi:hypothetical protein